MTIWRMRIACWIPKGTNVKSVYVVLTAFPLQQCLEKRSNVTLHVPCLSCWIQGVLKFGSSVDNQNTDESTSRILYPSLVFQWCGCVRPEPIGTGGNAVNCIWRGYLKGLCLKSQVHTDYPDWSFPSFSSVPPAKFPDVTLNWATTTSSYTTNSMEQSPSWEANRTSGSQAIPRVL